MEQVVRRLTKLKIIVLEFLILNLTLTQPDQSTVVVHPKLAQNNAKQMLKGPKQKKNSEKAPSTTTKSGNLNSLHNSSTKSKSNQQP